MHQHTIAPSCLICGLSPTVKSHILPRSLSLDLKRDDKHLVSSRLGENSLRKVQNGRWSYKILCDTHEKHLGPADKYGIEFARRAIAHKLPTAHFSVPNPQPDLLKKFILSLIWRADAAERADGRQSQLGSYEAAIRHCIFENGTLEAPIFFLRPNLTADGRPVPIALEPTRVRMRDCNGWKLGFGNLDAVAKLDKKPWPKEWSEVDASIQTSVLILDAEPSDIRNAPAYHPLIRQTKVFRV